ncbi:flagellin [Anaerobacillus sp. MEB173]|uniref:flagellin N-terminal helical domain-containing protein n=1 Tax=Anaerobacillus sp. MEB173 TaxID=3383345 RepID=UPI003F91E456
MIINNNIPALNTYRQMGANNAAGSKAMEKLSSGLRINRAGDDAAGLAISEKMRAQVRGLDQASRNSQDGISMIQTAEGALQETHNILQRMRELATQAANDTNVEVDRNEIQKEMNALTSEINRIGNTTEFNTQNILDGGAKANKTATASNEAVGTAARGAVLQSVNPDAVKTGNFQLRAGDFALEINGTSFSLNTTADTYNADSIGTHNTAAGLKEALENLKTSELGISLKDVADVDVTENGVVTITAKGTGDASEIKLTVATTGAAAPAATTLAADLGLPATLTGADTFTGTDGTAATIVGNDITNLTDLTKDDLIGKKFDITLNGETKTITLNADAVNAGTFTGGTINDADDLAAVINSAITSQLGANTVTVTNNGNEGLTFTQDAATIPADGSTPSLKISGDFASKLLGGITEGQNAVGGTFNATFQIGANQGQSMTIQVGDMRAQALGVSGTISAGSQGDVEGAKFTANTNVTNGTNNDNVEYSLDVSTHEAASAAIKVINNALEKVSSQRSDLGAYQNRLEHTISNLNNASENLQAAESRIRDVDMAKEVMEMTRANILGQASQAMLAQANQKPQSVLQLLG